MSVVGSQTTVALPNTGIITLNSNIYAVVKGTQYQAGNKVVENKVCGSDIPWMANKGFHGEGYMDVILSTDSALLLQALIRPVNGVVPPVPISWQVFDSAGRSSTITASIYSAKLDITLQGTKGIRGRLSFVAGARATQSSSGGGGSGPFPPMNGSLVSSGFDYGTDLPGGTLKQLFGGVCSFYANGRFWIFMMGEPVGLQDTISYTTTVPSTNPTWASAASITAAIGFPGDYNIWFDGTYFYYAFYSTGTVFRRYTPNADGSVTPSAGTTATSAQFVGGITVDSNGHPWVSVQTNGTFEQALGIRNQDTNGLWSPDEILNLGYSLNQLVYPLTGGKVVFPAGLTVSIWNGSSVLGPFTSPLSTAPFAAATDGTDNFYMAGGNMVTQFNYGTQTFGAASAFTPSMGTGEIGLSWDPVNAALYAFFTNTANTQVLYSSNSGSGWNPPVTLATAAAGETAVGNQLSCWSSAMNKFIGVAYTVETGAGRRVKFTWVNTS